jgi:hypothetical protein
MMRLLVHDNGRSLGRHDEWWKKLLLVARKRAVCGRRVLCAPTSPHDKAG